MRSPTFTDNRGAIINIYDKPNSNVAYITSVKGSIRSNHYHSHDNHTIYIISGSLKYSERNLDGSNSTEEVFFAGDKFFTPPMRVHRVEFLEDSAILSISNAPQTTDHHSVDCIPEIF